MTRIVFFVLIALLVFGFDSFMSWVFGFNTDAAFILIMTVFMYLDITKSDKSRWEDK